MSVLPNGKHERFAVGLAQGLSACQAYVEAGYKANDGNAGRLARSEEVKNRVEELKAQGAEKAGITVQRVAEELAKIAFGPEKIYKANDKISALEKLGKHLGMFVDKHDISGTLTLEQLVLESVKERGGK